MTKGILKIVEGDATDPQTTHEKEVVIIPHVCNNLGGWGAGFVVALSKKWPEPEKVYREYIENNKAFPVLGKVCYAKMSNFLVVANMIAQNGYQDAVVNPTPIKYKALVNAMAGVAAFVDYIGGQTKNPIVIHCPKFGSDLAGGDWNFILELIRELWLEVGIDVVVYEWVG
jgi:hypothetical protein